MEFDFEIVKVEEMPGQNILVVARATLKNGKTVEENCTFPADCDDEYIKKEMIKLLKKGVRKVHHTVMKRHRANLLNKKEKINQ